MNTPLPNRETNVKKVRVDGSTAETQRSYLLRLWRSGVDAEWRASLQAVQTGERHMFADLASLLAFLLER